MPRRPRRPRFYFSFRSPYSWLAARELDARGLGPTQVDYIPYYEPDARSAQLLSARGGSFAYRAMSKERRLYILQDIRRLTRARGLELRWPQDEQPWWEPAHLAYLWARRGGRQEELFWAVYRARWERGLDVARLDTVVELCAELGLDGAELSEALLGDELRSEGVEALCAAEKDGVFGVPFFTLGFDRFWGQDRLDAFQAALEARS